MRTLDSMLSTFDRRIAFIKLDIEGSEPLVVAGARHLIGRDRPRILFEFPPKALRSMGRDPNAMLQSLHDFRYRMEIVGFDSRAVGVNPDSPDELCAYVEHHHAFVEIFACPES